MTGEGIRHLQVLKDNVKKNVRILCTDGEVLVAQIVHVDEDELDVIYDLVSSNRPERYARPGAAYLLKLADVVEVDLVK